MSFPLDPDLEAVSMPFSASIQRARYGYIASAQFAFAYPQGIHIAVAYSVPPIAVRVYIVVDAPQVPQPNRI